MNRPRELAETSLRALRYNRNVLNAQRRAAFGHDDGVLDVADVLDEPYFTDIDLLQTCFDEAAAGVGVVSDELLFHLREAKSIGDQLIGVHANLIFARGSAKTRHVHDIRHSLEVLLD